MTRHFLRDKNGEEKEYYALSGESPTYDFIEIYPEGWLHYSPAIRFKKKELWRNGKLLYIVWEEIGEIEI